MDDTVLLEEYARTGAERAFTELVNRHIGLVYSAAHRQLRDAQLAQDVTQAVFIILARKAGPVSRHPGLSGWLLQTTRYAANAHIRAAIRRTQREQEAAMQSNLNDSSPAVWTQLERHLDEAMASLGETDRAVLALRYFENKPAHEIAQTLKLNEEATQKRASRALDKLRKFFEKKGITVSGAAIAAAVSANAVQAAPAGLAATIAATTLSGTALTTTATILATTKTIAMTAFQKTAIAAVLTITIGTGIYEARQAAAARSEAQTLREQQRPMAGQLQAVEADRDALSNRMTLLARTVSNQPEKSNELLALRGEVTRLRSELEQINDPIVKRALRWEANVQKMKQLFAEHPEQRVPEMQLLNDDRFFDLARDQNLESSNGIRQAFSEIRNDAKNQFAPILEQALSAYQATNGATPPAQVSDLKPYFDHPVDDAMLDQYQLLTNKSVNKGLGNYNLADKQVVDPEFDYVWKIGPNGYGPDSSGRDAARLGADFQPIQAAMEAYAAANGGASPSSLADLKPYISSPDQQAAYEKLEKNGGIPMRPAAQ